MIQDLKSKITSLEGLLQKITGDILANVAYEKIPPIELWRNSEADVNAVKETAEEIKNCMLLLKPERAPSIKRKFRVFMQPLNNFRETLLQKTAETTVNISRQALEHLRKAITESQEFIDAAKEISRSPSESMFEILKLKEAYTAKEYISKVSVPEVIYARLEYLKKSMEILRLRISKFEGEANELMKQMEKIQEEILKFQQAPQETP